MKTRQGITIVAFTVLSILAFVIPSWAQTPEKAGCFSVDGRTYHKCGQNWTDTYNGVVYDCTCNCPSRGSDCKPRLKSNTTGGYSGGSPSQQMAVGLFGSLLQGLMQEMLAPDSSSAPQESPQEKLKREQEQKQRWEEYAAKVKEQIATAEKEYGRLKREEFDKEKKSLVSDLKSRYAATFDSEGKTGNALRQLQCSAYWGLKAAEMTAPGGDTELARLYGEYSAQAKKGILTSECPEMNVNVPDVPAPQPAGGLQQEFYVFLLEETNQIIPVISNLKERKKVSQNIITSKQSEIETLSKKQDTSDDKGKQKIDTLLQEANKLLAEAMEEDKNVTEELNMAENKLKALQEMNKLYAVEKNPNKKEVK